MIGLEIDRLMLLKDLTLEQKIYLFKKLENSIDNLSVLTLDTKDPVVERFLREFNLEILNLIEIAIETKKRQIAAYKQGLQNL